MLKEKPDDSNVSARVRILLEEAGLESLPIDPCSLEALKAFVASDRSVNTKTAQESSTVKATTDENRPPGTFYPHPVSEIDPHRDLKRFTSELTSPSGDSLASDMEDSSVAVAGNLVHVEGASPVENQILEQLHRQTRLLLELHHRIDDLTATVEHLTGNGTGIPSRKIARAIRPRAPTATRVVQPPTAPGRPAPAPRIPVRTGAPPARNINAPGVVGLLLAIRNSRILKVASLFRNLRRRHVQELDGGLVFKILLMMAILTARMSSSGKGKPGDPDWHTKFAGLAILVIVGFLLQTGYLQYMYVFFVKENYLARIFNGEDVEEIVRNPNGQNNPPNNNNQPAARPGAPALPRGQLPPNHPIGAGAAAADGGLGGWRNTFLGGMIPQPGQGGVMGALQDVALLFGSFLMSIFPMWQPEGPPQPPVPAPQEQPAAQVPPPGAAGPGDVRPPSDAIQPADDNDDEDGN